jgi:hypothetical protein
MSPLSEATPSPAPQHRWSSYPAFWRREAPWCRHNVDVTKIALRRRKKKNTLPSKDARPTMEALEIVCSLFSYLPCAFLFSILTKRFRCLMRGYFSTFHMICSPITNSSYPLYLLQFWGTRFLLLLCLAPTTILLSFLLVSELFLRYILFLFLFFFNTCCSLFVIISAILYVWASPVYRRRFSLEVVLVISIY